MGDGLQSAERSALHGFDGLDDPYVIYWEVADQEVDRGPPSGRVHLRWAANHPRRIVAKVAEATRVLICRARGLRDRPFWEAVVDEAAQRGLTVGIELDAPASRIDFALLQRLVEISPQGPAEFYAAPAPAGLRRVALVCEPHTIEQTVADALATARGLGLATQLTLRWCRDADRELAGILRRIPWYVLDRLHFHLPPALARPSMSHALEGVLSALNRAARVRGVALSASDTPMLRRVRATCGAGDADSSGVPMLNDGRGMMCISAKLDLWPSPDLRLRCGNLLFDDLRRVYRSNPLMRALRNGRLVRGKCRACEFASRCGGSRALAYAYYGDPLASDPSCPFVGAEPL